MRRINLDGANNARTFVGLENRDGQKIRNPLYIRSNGLSRLTTDDVQTLQNQQLRRVIDLRSHTEVEEQPNVRIEGVEYIHLPLIDEAALGITRDRETLRKLAANPQIVFNMETMYAQLVTNESAVEQLAKVFKIITSENDGATLWHCAAGKDRCGLVSALFLKLLDVDDETIKEDYLLTNLSAQAWADARYQDILNKTGDEKIAEHFRKLGLADLSFMQAALDAIDEKWGNIDSFIQNQLGISKQQIEELKQRVLAEN